MLAFEWELLAVKDGGVRKNWSVIENTRRKKKVKTLKLTVWAFSLNFLHDFTLFVIDIHQNMPITLTPFDHFQNMSSGGIGPDFILTLCRKPVVSSSSSSSSVTSFKSLYKHHSLIHWLPSQRLVTFLHKFYWSMLVFSYERFIWKGKSWFLRIISGGDQSSGEELATRKSGDMAWVACFLSMWFIKCLPYFTYPFRIVPKRGVFQLHNLSSWWWSW